MKSGKNGTTAPEGRNGIGRPFIWLVSTALFLGMTVLGFWLVSKATGGGLPRLDERLLSPAALVLIGAFLIVYFLSDGLRLYFVLRTLGVSVAFRSIVPLVFINILFSNVTPLATGGGFAQVWYLNRRGVPVGTSAAATTIRTILAMLAIFIAAPLFHTLHASVEMDSMARIVGQSISAVILVYLVGFVILLVRPFWIASFAETNLTGLQRIGVLGEARRHRWTKAIRRETQAFSDGFHQFLRGPARYSLAAAIATAVFLLTLFSIPALLMSLLDYDVDWLLVIGTLAVVTFLMYFAPTPGGAGFAELAFAGLMMNQIDNADLLLVIFVWRLLVNYLGMAVGLIVSAVLLKPLWRRQ